MLTAKNISKNFGEIKVLDNINLNVEKGSIVSIYGSSGAGKSTLLYILSTLDKPDKGEIQIDNLSISELKGDKLSDFRNDKVGFIFQFHNLLDEFNVLENVCLPGYVSSFNNSYTENKAKELLKELGLSSRLNHKPNQLSGGEQQRVAIARSLINSPEIIFADEPTGNLDAKNSKTFIELIKKLNKKMNQTFVIVTHNKEFIKISDKSYTIQNGKLN
tara:strand:- start:441 stop:1091 length:651 start_codon:yes stop_codon:yes gene_type:complete